MSAYNPRHSRQPCMEAQALFGSSLPLVERIAGDLCRRAGIYGADAEDFASAAKLALVEGDYAVLRTFEGRSSLATYLTVVFSRLLADQQMRAFGRFRPSAEAARLGPAAGRVEALLARLRAALAAAGLDSAGVAELVGGAAGELDFGLAERENGAERQTLPREGEAGEMDFASREAR